MTSDKENPIYQHNTLEFVTVAAEYCAFVEQSESRTRDEFINTMLKLLPVLYMKAQLLPTVESDGEFLPDDHVTEQDYDYVRGNVYGILGKDDEYEDFTYDMNMQTEETVWKSVSEDLADTYQWLRNFVFAYQQRVEPCMKDALAHVVENFGPYWGVCLVGALKRLHHIRYTSDSVYDEEDFE